ncbi:ORC-CDC6 family AAA ATPase [Stenotrophomonas sepilia]
MSGKENFGGASVFNARDLKSADVAEGFIAPAAFEMLLSDSHCVLEGPRGSGKTTLLRMLTPDSYASWATAHCAEPINFVGVFVPADIRWARQLEARLSPLVGKVRKYYMEAAFSVATSIAVVATIEACVRGWRRYGDFLPNVFFPLERSQEVDVVSQLAATWYLKIGVPSFSGLKSALRARQQEIGYLAAMSESGCEWSEILSNNRFISSTWLDNIVLALQAVNGILERPEQRWAILLDELEIVPSEILHGVVQALRSTDPSIKFKLALSPTGTDLMFSGDNGAPSPENDYRAIPLWYEKSRDARAFSEKLFIKALGRNYNDRNLSRLLGVSRLGGDDDDRVGEQTDSVRRARIDAFVSLYQKDESFKDEMDRRKVDPANPPLSDASGVGTYVRKITPLVYLRDREIERFSDGVSRRKGGRKSGEAYFGYPNLLDLAEGNPRWILTLVDLLRANSSLSGGDFRSQGVQSSALQDYTNQFVSKLTVYPTGVSSLAQNWTLMNFIDALGEELESTLYRKAFSGDPALSFKLDARALQRYGDYIKLCIDLGALVIMRGGVAAPLGQAHGAPSLVDARVRISYRLAPRYQLPLRSTKERSLSGAIRGGELFDAGQVVAGHISEMNADSKESYESSPRQGKLL